MIRRKLRSQSGISILMVLLVFLLCAVIGSVLLTAATASVGRVAELSKTDQRYYNVVSAAKLFASQIDNQTVTVHQKMEESWTAYDDGTSSSVTTTFSEPWITDSPWIDRDGDGTVDPPVVGNEIFEGGSYAITPSAPTLLMDLVMDLWKSCAWGDGVTWNSGTAPKAKIQDALERGWEAVGSGDSGVHEMELTVKDGSSVEIAKVYGRAIMNGQRLEALFSNKPTADWNTLDTETFLVRVSADLETGSHMDDVKRKHEETPSGDDELNVDTRERSTRIKWTNVQIKEGR